MSAEVSMDYSAVEQMARQFDQSHDALVVVSRALEAAINILKATAFFGLVGNFAMAHYLEGIKPKVDQLAATCQELNQDLIGAIVSMRDGDTSGSQRFV